MGPNLDTLKPDAARVEKQITNGGAVMPAYVAAVAGKGGGGSGAGGAP